MNSNQKERNVLLTAADSAKRATRRPWRTTWLGIVGSILLLGLVILVDRPTEEGQINEQAQMIELIGPSDLDADAQQIASNMVDPSMGLDLPRGGWTAGGRSEWTAVPAVHMRTSGPGSEGARCPLDLDGSTRGRVVHEPEQAGHAHRGYRIGLSAATGTEEGTVQRKRSNRDVRSRRWPTGESTDRLASSGHSNTTGHIRQFPGEDLLRWPNRTRHPARGDGRT